MFFSQLFLFYAKFPTLDVCKDTSDTDASNDSFGTNCTETIATMEVFEYEVASSTGDDDAETGSVCSSSGSEVAQKFPPRKDF